MGYNSKLNYFIKRIVINGHLEIPQPINFVENPNFIQRGLIKVTSWGIQNYFLRIHPDYSENFGGLVFCPNTLSALDFVQGAVQNNPNEHPVLLTDYDGGIKPLFWPIDSNVINKLKELGNSNLPMYIATNRDPENHLVFRTKEIEEFCREIGVDPKLNLFTGLDQQTLIFHNKMQAQGLINALYLEFRKGIDENKPMHIYAPMDVHPWLNGHLSGALGLNAALMHDTLKRMPSLVDSKGTSIPTPGHLKPKVTHIAIL